MSDVRFLAPLTPRGTGIQRTTTQVPQRNSSTAASSHVSASPSAGARAQAQVVAARRPPGSRQEATITMLDRSTAATSASATAPRAPLAPAAAVAATQPPTVQIVERPRPPAAASVFTVEQMMLIGHLLDRYRENTMAINDAANATVAEGALSVLAGLLQATGMPAAQATAPSSSAPSAPATAVAPEDANAAGRARRRSRARRATGARVEARTSGDSSMPPDITSANSAAAGVPGSTSSAGGEASTPSFNAAPERT